MKTIDDTTLREWLDLDLDGALGTAEKAQLEARLAADAGWQAERRSLGELHAWLAADRLEARPEFAAEVVRSLPVAPWEKAPRAWLLPAALLAFFGVGAAWVLAAAGAATPSGALAGTAVTLVDFLASSALAGAGLLAASWRGLGMGLEQLFTESQVNLLVFGAAVLCLDLLFLRMLRRKPREPSPAAASDTEAPPRRV